MKKLHRTPIAVDDAASIPANRRKGGGKPPDD